MKRQKRKHIVYRRVLEQKGVTPKKERIEYITYCRKSEEDKGKQLLSLDRQGKWAERESVRNTHSIRDVFLEEKSARIPFQRPVFDDMVRRIKRGEVKGIYTWKLDRLARNPEEAGIIMGLLERGELQHIVTSQRQYRPDDNAIISYVDFGMADQYSRDLSKNVLDGLHNKARMGWYPCVAPVGYRNTKFAERGSNKILVDQNRFDKLCQAWQLMLTGNISVPQIKKIAEEGWNLTTRPTKTRESGNISRTHWYSIFTNPFYSGWYEYPKGTGQWHKGKHQPMITEEEFDRVQVLLGRRGKPRGVKPRHHIFTGIIRCGSCPAMVTAEHRTKKQKNGNVHFYTYYHCSRRVQPNCPERSIHLKDLEQQIKETLQNISISDEFDRWATYYIQINRGEEIRREHGIKETKRRALARIIEQIDNLNLKYTSPENANGRLFTDQEFLSLKHRLRKQEAAIRRHIEKPANDIAEQTGQNTNTAFELAHNVLTQFENGDPQTKRDILTAVGSNRILKDKKLLISLRKPLKHISRNRKMVEDEIRQVRTSKHGLTKLSFVEFKTLLPKLCALADAVRTAVASSDERFEIPDFSERQP